MANGNGLRSMLLKGWLNRIKEKVVKIEKFKKVVTEKVIERDEKKKWKNNERFKKWAIGTVFEKRENKKSSEIVRKILKVQYWKRYYWKRVKEKIVEMWGFIKWISGRVFEKSKTKKVVKF